MATFRLEINCDNAAFNPPMEGEPVAEAVERGRGRAVWRTVRDGIRWIQVTYLNEGEIMDENGNVVGTRRFEEDN